jgi:Protein of unknown function (DUF2851)
VTKAQVAHAEADEFRLSSSDFRSFSEADLSRLWEGQTFPPDALTTPEGERLRVVYRGRRTGGPGPDFRDALIAAPGGLLRGDVELHVRSSDFRRHGHNLDTAYAGVVLHLVFRCDEPGQTLLPGGGLARVVALEEWVAGRALEIRRWLERPALWREPCRSALERSGAEVVGSTLDRLGDMRFRARTAYFSRRLSEIGTDQALWEALLEALGYGGDYRAYRALAGRVRWPLLRIELLATPIAQRAADAYRLLAAEGEDLPSAGARALRPANRPERRLRGAAALAARFAASGPVIYFTKLLDGHGALGDRARAGKRKTENGNRVSSADSRFSVFGFRPVASLLIAALTVPGLIGRARAIELLANAVLPLLAAAGPEERARRAEAVYHALPLPARYGAVRHLHEAVGGSAEDGKRKTKNGSADFRFSNFDCRAGGEASVRINFRRQQGMLYLLKQYCTQGGCGRCPLS